MTAADGGHWDIVELLLEHGASLRDKDKDKNTTLIIASKGGNMKLVELILSKGANIHDKDICGCSSIMLASERGHDDVCELLLSKGANIHDKDNYGTSIYRALKPFISVFGGWLFDRTDIYGRTTKEMERAYTDVVYTLLAHGADMPFIRTTYSPAIKNILKKWPVFMGILALQGLSLYYILDARTIINLYQYLGEGREMQYIQGFGYFNMHNDDNDNDNDDNDNDE